MTLVWVASLVREDASLVDRFWGAGIVLLALVYQGWVGAPAHGWWMVALVALWGVRLSLHLTWRSWGAGEDPRYRALREASAQGWAWRSLATVFWLQGVVSWVIAMPALYAIYHGSLGMWTSPLGVIGVSAFALGWLYESVADWQLLRFKARAAQDGQVCQSGLWRFSRHPNYFGEMVLWWGVWAIAAAAGGWWMVFSPLLVTLLLARVTGVPLLERNLYEHRPAYADYARRTNALIPGPPR